MMELAEGFEPPTV